VSKKIKKIKLKKVLKRNSKKYTEAEVNKQTEYTKKFMKKITVGKYMEARDKCNNMIRTMEENQAWQNIQCGNWILSQQHK